ncbi:hypothetical protein FACS1894137_13780 [Spirochaetia bacterium]|nr:hypothetical protein FACS1894137_13780 [Spirochaetia bacterium]
MDDPRMADLANEPLPVREVHAWRLQVQDEKQGMSGSQLEAYYKASRERTQSFCAKHGIHLNYAPIGTRNETYGDIKTVAVHINRLRERIEQDPANPVHIQTVWGSGYRFMA